MKRRLLRTELSTYEEADWDGVNRSGWRPTSDLVLVLPDQASDKIGKLGLLVQPEDQRDRASLASESGVIIAIGDGAFVWNRDRTRAYEGAKPKPGDRVLYRRYAGQMMKGADGRSYRYMSDNEIGMVADAESIAAAQEAPAEEDDEAAPVVAHAAG